MVATERPPYPGKQLLILGEFQKTLTVPTGPLTNTP